MNASTSPKPEFVEIGRWAIGPETVPVMARFVPAELDEPGCVEVWAFDMRLFSLTLSDDGVIVAQHEDAPNGEAMTIAPMSINEVALDIDLARLKRLATLPDAP